MPKATKRPAAPAIGQPHDGLVKYAFSKREHAEGLLRSILPPALTAAIDWATLDLCKDSFIDPELRARYADLLFKARAAGHDVFIYALVEHQRSVEQLMIFRFSRYLVRIWDGLVREQPDLAKLPPIMPVLLSNSTTGWTAATRFEDIVDVPAEWGEAREAILPYVPRFEMRLVDLHPARAQGIVEEMLTAFGKLVLWALSVAGDDERFLREIERMRGAIAAALDAPDAHDALFALLRYLSSTHQRLGAKRIGKLLRAGAATRQESVIMDVLDELRQEGREEGRVEGREEGERTGSARILLKQLTARFGPVPADAKAKILSAKEAVLDRWALRVLTARSLQAVLSAPPRRAKKQAAPRKATRAART